RPSSRRRDAISPSVCVAPDGKPPAASAPGDRQGRVARLTATRGAGLGLPRRNRRFREPHGQAPALAQRDVIGSPIRHSVPLLRDVVTAVLVSFRTAWVGRGNSAGRV